MKDLGNYECEGQMSLKDLMDLIAPVVVDNEPPILLSEGQQIGSSQGADTAGN